jgi:probable rRNA maturation factor
VSEAIEVEIQIEPGAPEGLSPALLRDLARFVLAQEGRAGPLAVSLVVIDDPTIADLHLRHMGLAGPTDVLTFALDEEDAFISGEETPLLGEVVVSHETAAAQADAYGHDAAREVAFLCVHGLLHLLGYDDATDAERQAMLARQEALLSAFERQAGFRD